MRTITGVSVGTACLALLTFVVPVGAETIRCQKSASFLAPVDSPDHRKYAPDYQVKMVHLALDVTPDFKERSLDGKAVLRLKALQQPVRELTLDALDFQVRSVTATPPLQGYQATEEHLHVTFTEPLPPGQEAEITVLYHVEPARGLYFRTPEMGYRYTDTHLFTQGEEILARHWYPCLDAPSAMFTSEITCRVPERMTVISNGRLVWEQTDPGTGVKAVHWSQEKPHANYLITLVAGYFKKLEDRYRDIPLTFYTPASENQQAAANSFGGTRDMMAFFEKEIGVPYPWPKYDQVCVNDFVAGGMENTTATTLTDRTLFTDETETIESSEGLVAHELAHQWFGDLVTCKDWSHIWLNEGFATYYEALYGRSKNGLDAFLYELWQNRKMITDAVDSTPIVRRTFDRPGQMFGYLSYQKGGWVLHMLRAQLGEDMFRRCIKTYLERHRHQNVVTEDLRKVVEELSGLSFDQFFDQWLYHARQPELDISYSWDEPTGQAKVTVRQGQKLDANVLLFNFPLKLRFKGKFGQEDRTIQVSMKEEAFWLALPSAPELVRVDPDTELLARIQFSVPNAMLDEQYKQQNDMIGRLLAVEQWSKKGGADATSKLARALQEDGFYGVRIEASKGLRGLKTDEALKALLSSTNQPDARVRRQVTADIGGFYHESAYEYALALIQHEKNPEILGSALRTIAGYAKPEVQENLLKHLEMPSYRNRIADAAIAAVRLQDDPSYIQPLLDTLTRNEGEFTSGDFGQGLSALAYLARNEENKESVREFLLGHVNSSRRWVRVAALRALGTLGDPKALAVVEKFANSPRADSERTAAEEAARTLRAARRPVDDFKNLREEVLELQKSGRELRKELEELRKRFLDLQKPGQDKPPKPASTEQPEEKTAK